MRSRAYPDTARCVRTRAGSRPDRLRAFDELIDIAGPRANSFGLGSACRKTIGKHLSSLLVFTPMSHGPRKAVPAQSLNEKKFWCVMSEDEKAQIDLARCRRRCAPIGVHRRLVKPTTQANPNHRCLALGAPHSITSSAWASTDGAIVMPSSFAASQKISPLTTKPLVRCSARSAEAASISSSLVA